jgi:hypothetical protein
MIKQAKIIQKIVPNETKFFLAIILQPWGAFTSM